MLGGSPHPTSPTSDGDSGKILPDTPRIPASHWGLPMHHPCTACLLEPGESEETLWPFHTNQASFQPLHARPPKEILPQMGPHVSSKLLLPLQGKLKEQSGKASTQPLQTSFKIHFNPYKAPFQTGFFMNDEDAADTHWGLKCQVAATRAEPDGH